MNAAFLPVACADSVTSALGTFAPEESRIAPEIEALVLWADSLKAKLGIKIAMARRLSAKENRRHEISRPCTGIDRHHKSSFN